MGSTAGAAVAHGGRGRRATRREALTCRSRSVARVTGTRREELADCEPLALPVQGRSPLQPLWLCRRPSPARRTGPGRGESWRGCGGGAPASAHTKAPRVHDSTRSAVMKTVNSSALHADEETELPAVLPVDLLASPPVAEAPAEDPAVARGRREGSRCLGHRSFLSLIWRSALTAAGLDPTIRVARLLMSGDPSSGPSRWLRLEREGKAQAPKPSGFGVFY